VVTSLLARPLLATSPAGHRERASISEKYVCSLCALRPPRGFRRSAAAPGDHRHGPLASETTPVGTTWVQRPPRRVRERNTSRCLLAARNPGAWRISSKIDISLTELAERDNFKAFQQHVLRGERGEAVDALAGVLGALACPGLGPLAAEASRRLRQCLRRQPTACYMRTPKTEKRVSSNRMSSRVCLRHTWRRGSSHTRGNLRPSSMVPSEPKPSPSSKRD